LDGQSTSARPPLPFGIIDLQAALKRRSVYEEREDLERQRAKADQVLRDVATFSVAVGTVQC